MFTPRQPRSSFNSIPENLRRAYASALYRVAGAVPATLTTATSPEDATRWLDAVGAHSATVVTEWNPFGEKLAEAENEAVGAELRCSIVEAGYAYVDARRTDPEAIWSEDGLCVFDASDDTVDLWLLDFGQDAALMLRRGEAPALRWHP